MLESIGRTVFPAAIPDAHMPKPADNYLRYLPISERERKWGLYVSDAGWQSIQPGQTYPPKGHPRSYAFTWEHGRVLPEYQLVYIVRGEGKFDSEPSGPRPVTAGSMILLFPGVWHRYRPALAVGWASVPRISIASSRSTPG
jgi:hypothetical protein